MEHKPLTDAQQKLYGIVADYFSEENREKMLAWVRPIIEQMTDAEAEDEAVICGGIENTFRESFGGDYPQNKFNDSTQESLCLTIIFDFVHTKNAKTYWSKHKEDHTDLLQLFLKIMLDNGKAEFVGVSTERFLSVRQNKLINALPAIMKTGWQLSLDGRTAFQSIGKGKQQVNVRALDIPFDVELSPDIATKANAILSPSDYYLLTALHITDYRTGHNGDVTCLPLKTYAELTGRSTERESLKRVRAEVLESMDRLSKLRFDYHDKVKQKYVYSGDVSFFGGTKIVKGGLENGVIRWTWNPDYVASVQNYSPMAIERAALKANKKTNTLFFAVRIGHHFRANINRPSERNTLSLAALIDGAPNLPKIEDVRKNQKSPKTEIIDKVFRDLDALEDFYYSVIDKQENEIEIDSIATYERFISCKIRFDDELYGIPASQRLIEEKNKREKQQKRVNKKSETGKQKVGNG